MPQTIHMVFPGNWLFVKSILPEITEFETAELVTGELGSTCITSLKVKGMLMLTDVDVGSWYLMQIKIDFFFF